jgi:hypothetical protein
MAIRKIKISELPLAQSLVGLYTIGVDALNRSVKVGLEFVKNAADNATSAATSANNAATSANAAASSATTAATDANAAANAAAGATDMATTAADNATVAASSANTAATNAATATTDANAARDAANTAALTANTAKEAANTAATGANAAASTATTAAGNADTATALALAATQAAQDTASHPTYVGQDFYVYKWNSDTKAYNKTDIYVKGEGFSIEKVYASVGEMNADYNNPSIKVGQFVLVNTSDTEHPDNAKLYVKGSSAFEFVVDMSGAVGFTGKTPQLSAGATATTAPGTTAAVSVSEDGQDEAGNPRYKLNFSIPRGNEGKPLIVLPNGNYGNWNDASGEYEDSGVEAAATVNLEDVPVAFTQAETKDNILTGETLPVILGKLKKWFSSFGALAWKSKVIYTSDIDSLPRLGQVIYKAENKTTAASTAIKVLTVSTGYTPTDGDLLRVIWTIANSASSPSFSIGGTVYPVWYAGKAVDGYDQYSSITAGAVIQYYFDGTRFHQIGSNLKAQDWKEQGYTTTGITTGEATFPNRFMMEAADGKFYSPVTSSASTTAATKPVATIEFKLNGRIFITLATIASAMVGATSPFYITSPLTSNWNTYGLNGSGHLGTNRMCYLKGSINANGNFVLDNTSLTSFYTTDVPTDDDGVVYIEFIWIGSSNTRAELLAVHRAYWFKDGKFRPYGTYGEYEAAEDGGIEINGRTVGIDDATMGKINHVPVQKALILLSDAWTETEDGYRYTVTDTDILALRDAVDVWPSDRASQTAFQQVEPDTLVDVRDGEFILTAAKAPGEDIHIIYEIRWVKED